MKSCTSAAFADPQAGLDAAVDTPSVVALPQPLRPSWQTLVLVCGRCSRRGGGPKRLSGKKLQEGLRQAMKASACRGRVVETACLGLCPRRAIAVAVPQPGGGLRAYAVKRRREAAFIVPSCASTID